MKTIFLRNKNNIAESAVPKMEYDPVTIIVEGLLSVTGKQVTNKDILTGFNVNLKESNHAVGVDEIQTEFLTESLYNPILTIHNLKKAGRTESIDILAEAYENFIDLVNKYGLEMEKENQEIIESAVRIFKKATE